MQVTNLPGWKATVAGQERPILSDGLGFLLIRPQCEGPCQIDLKWTGSPDLYVSALISILVLAWTVRLLMDNRSLIARASYRYQDSRLTDAT